MTVLPQATSRPRLVRAGAGSDPQAPRVLTPTFVERLARLTAAEREIRRLGYTVVWSRLAGQLPELHLFRDADVSMIPMLNRMTNKAFYPRDGHTVVVGDFMDCQVSWLEG